MAQRVKNLLAAQEKQRMWVQPLGWKYPRAEENGNPLCKIPWTEEPGGLQSKGSQSRR